MTYARVNFGMGIREFMRVTPRYFDALVQRHEVNLDYAHKGRDIMLAQLIAMVANTGARVMWEEWREPKEFLPTYASDRLRPEKRRKRISFDEQMRRTMERAVAYQAGQSNRGIH